MRQVYLLLNEDDMPGYEGSIRRFFERCFPAASRGVSNQCFRIRVNGVSGCSVEVNIYRQLDDYLVVVNSY
jgi:predicted metalloprotease